RSRARVGAGVDRTAVDDAHHRRARRDPGAQGSLPVLPAPQLRGGGGGNLRAADGVRPVVVRAVVHGFECRGAFHPNPRGKLGAAAGSRHLRSEPRKTRKTRKSTIRAKRIQSNACGAGSAAFVFFVFSWLTFFLQLASLRMPSRPCSRTLR